MVREVAVEQLVGLSDNDIPNQIARLLSFVRERMVYVADPVNAEYIISPIRLLQQIHDRGYSNGDCDDHVMLFNTMLGSIGITTKFVGVKLGGASDYNHVISGVMIGDKMTLLDPCSKSGVDREYTDILTV